MLSRQAKLQRFSDKVYAKLAKKVYLNNPKPPKLEIGIPIKYVDKKRNYGGVYVATPNMIYLHSRLTLKIRETIVHEVCHAIAWHWKGTLTHGNYWQMLMKLLGYKPKIKAEDWRLHSNGIQATKK